MATQLAPILVFNGFAEIVCTFDGRKFVFPENKTTMLGEHYSWAADEYMQNHPSSPDPSARLERTYTPTQMVEILFTSTGENLISEGCVLIGDKDPDEASKTAARERGRIRKAKLVQDALADNRARHTKGVPGLPLTEQLMRWVKELDITDEVYNNKADERDPAKIGSDIAAAILAGLQPAGAGAPARK